MIAALLWDTEPGFGRVDSPPDAPLLLSHRLRDGNLWVRIFCTILSLDRLAEVCSLGHHVSAMAGRVDMVSGVRSG
jgi:hypothetical protein